MAESLVRDQRSAEIHLFSDGAVSGLEEFENKALPLVFHRFGQSSENVGITALDVRSNPENRDERAIYASVVNHSTNAQTVAVELLFDGVRQETRPVRVGPDESAPQVFLVTQPRDGVFTVRLAATDDLKADNQASIVSLLPQPVNVLLVTRGNRLLEKALQSVGNVRLSVVPDLTETAEYDFVVLDNLAPSYWPRGNVLAYRVAGTNWIESFTELTAPPIVDWRPTHPLLRYAGFENVQIARGVGAKVPGWAVSIADAPQASLILAGELGRQRIVWIGFDILESNWPLRVSFPIFMANAVDWLNPAAVSSASLMVKGGDPFRYALPRPEPRAKVTLPSGETRDLDLSGSPNELVFAETQRQGAYRVQAGTNNLVFCVNLLDAAESNTRPKAEIQLGQHASVQATAVRRANMEVWRTIAAFALVLLLGEWWYYHRRTE
jgi:hypothetical protein